MLKLKYPSALVLLLICVIVSVEESGSSPYKIRFYKYIANSANSEDCDYEDDYGGKAEPPPPPPSPRNRVDSEPDYRDEEDCNEEEKSPERDSYSSEYPDNGTRGGQQEEVEGKKKEEEDCCPGPDSASDNNSSSSPTNRENPGGGGSSGSNEGGGDSTQNVIPATNNRPEYPQWGAHIPKNPGNRDYDEEENINRVHPSNGGGTDTSSGSDYPDITNVQGKEAPAPRSPYPGFSRPCESQFDCDFATPYTNTSEEIKGSTWFSCDGTYCICELFGITRDGDIPLRVGWNKELRKCLSGLRGPCGTHGGLNLYCELGLVCDESFICEKPGRKKPKKPTAPPPCDCPGECEDEDEPGGDNDGPDVTSLFSFLFFPSNTFHSILNNSLHGIVGEGEVMSDDGGGGGGGGSEPAESYQVY